jgi:hypothetical protein
MELTLFIRAVPLKESIEVEISTFKSITIT